LNKSSRCCISSDLFGQTGLVLGLRFNSWHGHSLGKYILCQLYCFLLFNVNCFFSCLDLRITSFLPAYTLLGDALSRDSCGVALYVPMASSAALFNSSGNNIIDQQVQLLFGALVQPSNLPSPLRMIKILRPYDYCNLSLSITSKIDSRKVLIISSTSSFFTMKGGATLI